MDLTRNEFMKGLALAAVTGVLPKSALALQDAPTTGAKVTLDELKTAQKVAGVDFTDDELKKIVRSVQSFLDELPELRKAADDWQLAPACTYHVPDPMPKGNRFTAPKAVTIKRPKNDEDLAFLPLADLANLIKTKQITSVELTNVYLARLKKYGPKLRCVATLTEERALKEAKQADEEIKAGKYRGPLHGIPYGVKDLFAANGYPTQWGCTPYIGQEFDFDSAVVEKLGKAGAVLVAKLSLGALAMNDVWYEGRTESPWNAKIGSSGSSAGSGSATAAGLVAFSIGTETSGSIISPSNNCRVVGLRPTFGSVSRYGGMTLCWSLDKTGPICRTAEDAALVFRAIIGQDHRDGSSIERPFEFKGKLDLAKVKLGILVNKEELLKQPVDTKGKPHLELLVKLGAKLTPVFLPPGPDGLEAILNGECAASFDSYTRSDRILKHKENQWPDIFRSARFTSAVDYIQADRVRRTLAHEYMEILAPFDAVVTDTRELFSRVYQLNCTGHPQILVPMAMNPGNVPQSISFIGKAYSEGTLLGLAQTVIEANGRTKERPDMSLWA